VNWFLKNKNVLCPGTLAYMPGYLLTANNTAVIWNILRRLCSSADRSYADLEGQQ